MTLDGVSNSLATLGRRRTVEKGGKGESAHQNSVTIFTAPTATFDISAIS